MIELAEGNLLQADVQALINAVNTEGVMGKGIALQFKRAFPAMFKEYEREAKAGRLETGRVHVFDLGGERQGRCRVRGFSRCASTPARPG